MIPGVVVNALTFPGVMFHEYSHKRACEWRGVPVYEVQYLDDDLGGHVTHGQPRTFKDVLTITLAPFLGNTVLAIGFYVAAIVAVIGSALLPEYVGIGAMLVGFLFGWLGVSSGWHAIPSFTDANQIANFRNRQGLRSTLLVLVAAPLLLVIYLANLLKFFWIDAVYAFGLAFLVWTALGL